MFHVLTDEPPHEKTNNSHRQKQRHRSASDLFGNHNVGFLMRRLTNEPRREKTGLRGFRPGPTQTGLYKLRKELEA